MRCTKANDEKAVHEWWTGRLAENRLRLRNLAETRRTLLAAWYILAVSEPIREGERLPLRYADVIAEISPRGYDRSRRFKRQRINANDRRRIVRRRSQDHQLFG